MNEKITCDKSTLRVLKDQIILCFNIPIDKNSYMPAWATIDENGSHLFKDLVKIPNVEIQYVLPDDTKLSIEVSPISYYKKAKLVYYSHDVDDSIENWEELFAKSYFDVKQELLEDRFHSKLLFEEYVKIGCKLYILDSFIGSLKFPAENCDDEFFIDMIKDRCTTAEYKELKECYDVIWDKYIICIEYEK